MAKAKIVPPLGLLVALELDEAEVARLTPLYRAFCLVDYQQRHSLLAQVRRIQAVVRDLEEADCLEILAAIGRLLNGGERS